VPGEEPDWTLYVFDGFRDRIRALIDEVGALQRRDPDGYRGHPHAKLLKAILKAMKETVPAQPDHPDFQLGSTLGASYRHWKRVKNGLPPRFRLFFRFDSATRTIVYVWLNDEGTLRQAGARSDVYKVFRAMLDRGDIPDNYVQLRQEAAGMDRILGNLPARPVQIPDEVLSLMARGANPIRAWREYRRYNPDDVASALGLSADEYAAMEAGTTPVPADLAGALAAVLCCEIEALRPVLPG